MYDLDDLFFSTQVLGNVFPWHRKSQSRKICSHTKPLEHPARLRTGGGGRQVLHWANVWAVSGLGHAPRAEHNKLAACTAKPVGRAAA